MPYALYAANAVSYTAGTGVSIAGNTITNTAGVYSAWAAGVISDSYYTKLQKEVYELLNGKLELPKDLLDKIEKFNSKETKDRKKILKGIDY